MTRATSLLLFLALITYYQTNALVDPDVKLLVKMMSGLFSTSNDARKEKYTVIEVPGLMAQAGIYYRSYDKYGYKKDIFFLAVSQTNGVISLTYHNITRTFSDNVDFPSIGLSELTEFPWCVSSLSKSQVSGKTQFVGTRPACSRAVSSPPSVNYTVVLTCTDEVLGQGTEITTLTKSSSYSIPDALEPDPVVYSTTCS